MTDPERAYRAANQQTLALWQEKADIGAVKSSHYYDPDRLALAAGIKPALTNPVARLLQGLQQLTAGDPLADVLPASGFHFTFLPITLPLFAVNAPLPAKTTALVDLWQPYRAQPIVIRQLRLVALPAQLLLAGIPDAPAIALRHAFCEQVAGSAWQNELRQRHGSGPLPAPFWHSTLLRYQADRLPAPLRACFFRQQTFDFGAVSAPLMLARVNYNWTVCEPIDHPMPAPQREADR